MTSVIISVWLLALVTTLALFSSTFQTFAEQSCFQCWVIIQAVTQFTQNKVLSICGLVFSSPYKEFRDFYQLRCYSTSMHFVCPLVLQTSTETICCTLFCFTEHRSVRPLSVFSLVAVGGLTLCAVNVCTAEQVVFKSHIRMCWIKKKQLIHNIFLKNRIRMVFVWTGNNLKPARIRKTKFHLRNWTMCVLLLACVWAQYKQTVNADGMDAEWISSLGVK